MILAAKSPMPLGPSQVPRIRAGDAARYREFSFVYHGELVFSFFYRSQGTGASEITD